MFVGPSRSKAPVLETGRLRLRPYERTDLDEAAAMWADHAVVAFIGRLTRGRADVWTQLQRAAGSWSLLGYGYWAVEQRESGEYLGEAGFLEGLRPIEPSNAGKPEAGWCLKQSAWGQGFATEAVHAILSWADEVLATSTTCIIETNHQASLRIAAKVGYQQKQRVTLHDTPLWLFERPRTHRKPAFK